jgi:predicted NAD/FAD-binding protein
MPKSKSAWTSWNYIGKESAAKGGKTNNDAKPVFVTYWLNKLQHLVRMGRFLLL